jgi:orotidine 5'-phosphate decarboxylase subfamily 2
MSVFSFGARLRAAIDARGPLCVGIDAHPALLTAWELTDGVAGLEQFAGTAVATLADSIAVLKFQSAFFERHGSAGIAVLERVVAQARAAGAVVIIDAKRGDIGSTMQAYADAYVDPRSPLFADAVTVSPYCGFDALRPVLDTADHHGAGVFVLALTSNPDAGVLQRARGADGRTVAGTILDHARAINAGATPLGSVGCVVGATIAANDEDLNINGPLLAPGLGAQGATPANLRRVFRSVLQLVLPASSRDVLAAGPSPAKLRGAAEATRDACAAALAE